MMRKLGKTDIEALTRAVEVARGESPQAQQQIDSMLKERPWERVAIFCACAGSSTM